MGAWRRHWPTMGPPTGPAREHASPLNLRHGDWSEARVAATLQALSTLLSKRPASPRHEGGRTRCKPREWK